MLRYKTIAGELVIREYMPGDEEAILHLFSLVFGKKKSLKVWEWEFLKNPYGTQIMLAFLNGQLVAQCASIPVRMWCRGKTIKAAQVVDCMSHPSCRGVAVKKRGIFALTVQAFFDRFTGCDTDMYIYGFPGERHYLLGRKLLGYRKTRPIAEIIVRPRTIPAAKVKNLTSDEEILERIPESWHPSELHILKSKEYVKWRYLLHPEHPYAFLEVKLPFVGSGLAIVRYAGECVHLVDYMGRLDLVRATRAVARYFWKDVSLWIPEGHKWEGWFRGEEIKPPEIKAIPTGISFCETEVPWDWANEEFFYTKGDSDLF